MRKMLWSALASRHRRQAVASLRALERTLPSPATRFAVPFVFRGKGFFRSIAPRQNPAEIEGLYRLACDLRPRRVLEIGTAKGGSLYLWTQAATPDATIVSVDLPGGDFGGAYAPCRAPFYSAFARPDQKLHLLLADSHAPETGQRVRGLLAGQPIDFAFIDGDHTYEGVKADFRDYGPLVRAGGLIAFHDILPRPDMPDIQVERFWGELRRGYECQDVVGPDGSGRKIGIGVLRVPAGGIKPL